MTFRVIWSAFAEEQLDKIFEYHLKKAGLNVTTKIVTNLILAPDKLIANPYLGVNEELLPDKNYIYIVYTNYKIIYSVDEENGFIKIADIFDTRQNPIKLKRNT